MIFVVDDDSEFTWRIAEILSQEGYNVQCLDSAVAAMETAVSEEPELILSDIVMPELSGFKFREVYAIRFPNRRTPFIYFSSLSDPGSIVRGLDLGADDYIVKPVTREVLLAKIRCALRRKQHYSIPVFHGDLAKLPLASLLKFCELKCLTGELKFSNGDLAVTVPVRGGSVLLEQVDEGRLKQLHNMSEGCFVIYAHPPDFGEIESAAPDISPAASSPVQDRERPMGKLSGVRVNNKLFQVQTEFVTYPAPQAVTIVILDGKVVIKRSARVLPEKSGRQSIERMLEEQHASVEDEVRVKISDFVKMKSECR